MSCAKGKIPLFMHLIFILTLCLLIATIKPLYPLFKFRSSLFFNFLPEICVSYTMLCYRYFGKDGKENLGECVRCS